MYVGFSAAGAYLCAAQPSECPPGAGDAVQVLRQGRNGQVDGASVLYASTGLRAEAGDYQRFPVRGA